MNKSPYIVIDDSEVDVFIIRKILEFRGLSSDVKSFGTAKKGLDFFMQNLGSDNFPNSYLILDIQLPGMNGFDFLDEFKKFEKTQRDKIKIIMLSSTIDKDELTKARENPLVIDIMRKPLEVDELIRLTTENPL